MDYYNRQPGGTGKAAMIPASIGTIGGIQAIQQRQNEMALQEMKAESIRKEEEFMNQPMSIDYLMAQTGFQPGTKAHEYMRSQFDSVAQDGWTTRGKIRQLQQFMKGSEQHTVGFINAQIEDADEAFNKLQDDLFSKKEKLQGMDAGLGGRASYKEQQQIKTMEGQLRSLDMTRKALRDKLSGTQEAFKQQAQYDKAEMQKQYDERTKQMQEVFKNERTQLEQAVRQFVETFKAREATNRKGVRPTGVAQRYRITLPDGSQFTQSLAEGEDIKPNQYPNGTKIEKIEGGKKEEKKGANWREGAGAKPTGSAAPVATDTNPDGTKKAW